MAASPTENGPGRPLIEATQDNRTRVSWYGAGTPDAIDGLKVSYFSDGMMCIGPIDTPVRYRGVTEEKTAGLHVIELQLSLAGLRMLSRPREENSRFSTSPGLVRSI